MPKHEQRSVSFLRKAVGIVAWLFVSFAALSPNASGGETANPPLPPAFWVWNRTTPIQPSELAGLERLRVDTLFWHAGTLKLVDGRWRWTSPRINVSELGAGLHVVPVVRIEPPASLDLAGASLLSEELKAVATPDGELQLDFDCPDRLLRDYAAFLGGLRGDVPRLSITALPHWSRLPGWEDLQDAVTEMAPMFYDLRPDPVAVRADSLPPPLLDNNRVDKLLESWRGCRIPWRAGLPVFSRLTIYRANGGSRGQVSAWSWEDICFNSHLRHKGESRAGVTVFRADAATRVGRVSIDAGEWVAARCVDPSVLVNAIRTANISGAAGVIFFRLPAGNDADGTSLDNLASLSTDESPRLRLAREGDKLVLTNEAGTDLLPRLAGERHDRDRGYALEIDAPAPVFREAVPGEFWRVGAHANPETAREVSVSIPLATRLTFWFSDLPAGDQLVTGLVQLAPGADWTAVRYRVLNVKDSEWRALK